MRRATIAAATGLGIVLAFAHPWSPGEWTSDNMVYLPHVSQRQPRPAATAVPRPTYRPASAGALIDALTVPGALVLPEPGVYRLGRDARVAPGVTLNGRGGVEIRWHGLDMDGAAGAQVLGLALRDCAADCISVTRAPGVLIQDVRVFAPSGDGLIDIIRTTGAVTLRDVDMIGPHPKCGLIGHQWVPSDAGLTVLLERVTYTDCFERVPKVHRATVTLRDVTITRWRGDGIDVQLGGRVILDGVTFEPGPKSHERWQTASGGTVEVR